VVKYAIHVPGAEFHPKSHRKKAMNYLVYIPSYFNFFNYVCKLHTLLN